MTKIKIEYNGEVILFDESLDIWSWEGSGYTSTRLSEVKATIDRWLDLAETVKDEVCYIYKDGSIFSDLTSINQRVIRRVDLSRRACLLLFDNGYAEYLSHTYAVCDVNDQLVKEHVRIAEQIEELKKQQETIVKKMVPLLTHVLERQLPVAMEEKDNE